MYSKLPKIWWIRNNVGGLFSAFLTVFLILYAMVVVVKLVILPWMGFNIHVILFVLCCLLSFTSHCLAQFSNPGSIPETFVAPDLPEQEPVFDPENPLPVTLRICKVCLTLKPQNTYHCSICGKCILRMDHHCPWVNNCVGIYNQKYFILFLFYTALCCIYTGVLLVLRFFSCTSKPKTCSLSGLETALCIVAFIEALIFGLFVIIMMFDQISAIMDEDEEARATYEEEYEKNKLAEYNNTGEIPPKPASKSTYQALCEVFGEKPSIGWLIPRNPKGIHEVFQKDLQKCHDKADKTLQQIVLHLKKSELKYKALQTMEERLRNENLEEMDTCQKQEENLEGNNPNDVEENSDNSNNAKLSHRRAQKIKK